MCDFCSVELCDEEECWGCGKECADCGKVMCHRCMGDTCGYCSDPAGWKKYYCKEHQEPTCIVCDDLICAYCNTSASWCDKCEDGPFHNSNYGESCYTRHVAVCDVRRCGWCHELGIEAGKCMLCEEVLCEDCEEEVVLCEACKVKHTKVHIGE